MVKEATGEGAAVPQMFNIFVAWPNDVLVRDCIILIPKTGQLWLGSRMWSTPGHDLDRAARAPSTKDLGAGILQKKRTAEPTLVLVQPPI